MQLFRVIGVLAHLQGGCLHIVCLQHSFHSNIVVLIGLGSLTVKLVTGRADGFLDRMGQSGGRLCRRLLPFQSVLLFLCRMRAGSRRTGCLSDG